MRSVWPPRSPVSASVAPLYGTWTILMPVITQKSSPDRCTVVPEPDEP